MDFRELSYVLAIAEHKSISKAAKHLFISQPSLSKFLKAEEEKLGVKLFERIDREMCLTFAGEKFVEIARQIFVLQRQLSNTINDIAQSKKGQISIGTTYARAKYVMPLILPVFKMKYPGFAIRSYGSDVPTLEQNLSTGAIDLALYTVTERKPEFEYHHIRMEEIVLAMSPDNPLASKALPREGFRHPWIDVRLMRHETFLMVPAIWRIGKVGAAILEEADMTPEQIVFSTAETAIAAASRGLGVCFCSDMSEQHYESSVPLRYFSIGERPIPVEFVVALRRSMEMPKAFHEFIDMVRSTFGED